MTESLPSKSTVFETQNGGKTEKVIDPMRADAEKEEQKMFDKSTHGYLIYFGEHRDVNNLLLAIFIYCVQLTLYSELWAEAMGLTLKDQVEVTIGHGECVDIEGTIKYPVDFGDLELNCEAAESETHLVFHMTLPFVLLSIYIQPDVISCFSVIFGRTSLFKKLMALVVIVEAGFGLLTGLLWAYQGISKGSGYDAIVNSIGVLFIHDLDEKLFESVERMNSSRMKDCMGELCCGRCKCCHNFCSLICTILFIAIVAILGVIVEVYTFAALDANDDNF